MTYHHIQCLLYIFAYCSLVSCTHQSAIKPSTAHIDEPPLSTKATFPDTTITNTENVAANSTDTSILSTEIKTPVYNIVVYDTPVKEVLFAMARDSKINIDIHPAIQGRITLNAVDQTLPAILARIR